MKKGLGKILRTVLLMAALVAALGISAAAAETETGDGKNGYDVTISSDACMVYATISAPEDVTTNPKYILYFYNEETGDFSYTNNFRAGHEISLWFVNREVDCVRLYDMTSGSTVDTATLVADFPLGFTINGRGTVFTFPHTDAYGTVTLNPDATTENRKYQYEFYNLDTDSYHYRLTSPVTKSSIIMNSCSFTSSNKFTGENMELTAMRGYEKGGDYFIEWSTAITLDLPDPEAGGLTDEEQAIIDAAEEAGLLEYLEVEEADSTLTRLDMVKLVAALLDLDVVETSTSSFTDCGDLTDLERGIIEVACDEGLVAGTSSGAFAPSASMTRAAVATVLYRALNPNDCADMTFDDVASSTWFYSYVTTLYNLGIIPGSTDNCFYPTDVAALLDVLEWMVNAEAWYIPEWEFAVRNLRIEDGLVCWDLPTVADRGVSTDEFYYSLYLDDGTDSSRIVSTRGDLQVPVTVELPAGTYDYKLVVETVGELPDRSVTAARGMRATLTVSWDEKDASDIDVSLVPYDAEDRYTVGLSGLTPDTYCSFFYKFSLADSGCYGFTFLTDEDGNVEGICRNGDSLTTLYEDGGYYQVVEFAVNSSTSNSIDYTVRPYGDWTDYGQKETAEDYAIEVYLESPALIANITGPADAVEDDIYSYVFASSKDSTLWTESNGAGLNENSPWVFEEAGYYDTYQVLLSETEEVLGEGTLEKPIQVKENAFTISGVTMRADEDDANKIWLDGLDLENYVYKLYNRNGNYGMGFRGRNYFYWDDDDFDAGAIIYAYRNTDAGSYYLQEISEPLMVEWADDSDSGNEYAVSNIRFEEVYLAWDAPEAATSDTTYDVYAYSAAKGEWVYITSGSRTVARMLCNISPDNFKGIRVVTVMNGDEVATAVNESLVYTVYREVETNNDLDAVFTDNGDGTYTMDLAGLSANTEFRIFIRKGTDANSSSYGSSSDSNGAKTRVLSKNFTDKIENSGMWRVHEYRNVGGSSTELQYTEVVLNNWADCLSGEVPDGDVNVGVDVSVGTASGITVVLKKGEDAVSAARGQNGKYAFDDVEEDTYDVVISKPGCLTWTITDVTFNGESMDLPQVEMVAGDFSGDDRINLTDLAAFRADFGKRENLENGTCDIDGDGRVNLTDLAVFRQNFGKTAERNCTISCN